MLAMKVQAEELSIDASQSFASLRQRPSQAKVRSTTQRRGRTSKPLLAQLTSNVRGTDFLIDNNIQDQATWFDLAKMLGFEDMVISDGATWSHRVIFE